MKTWHSLWKDDAGAVVGTSPRNSATSGSVHIDQNEFGGPSSTAPRGARLDVPPSGAGGR